MGATLFLLVKLRCALTEIWFPPQPGACNFLAYALNTSQKHVFDCTFSVFFAIVFFQIFAICRRRRSGGQRLPSSSSHWRATTAVVVVVEGHDCRHRLTIRPALLCDVFLIRTRSMSSLIHVCFSRNAIFVTFVVVCMLSPE